MAHTQLCLLLGTIVLQPSMTASARCQSSSLKVCRWLRRCFGCRCPETFVNLECHLHMDIKTFHECNNCATLNVWQVERWMIMFEQELWITIGHLASMGDARDHATSIP